MLASKLKWPPEVNTDDLFQCSGRCPEKLTLELLSSEGFSLTNPFPPRHAHTVTVPGAAAGWVDTVERFGSGKVIREQLLSLSDLLQPAIELAEKGYPVAPVAAYLWELGSQDLQKPSNCHGRDMLLNGHAPKAGEIMQMPHLANTFRALAAYGRAGFYEGAVAEAIVACVREHGGVMTLDDLRSHRSTFDEPIKTRYRDIDIWEIPPNGQGITALIALNILEGFDFKKMEHNSVEYLHTLIEAMQLSFADTWWYTADQAKVKVPVEELLSKHYAATRRQLMAKDRCLPLYNRGNPFSSSDTVYFSVVDPEGNACSFINSNYMGFGTGLVPEGCGFTLQNRGANFSLDPTHPNALSPGKRSYHTIIPGMATRADTGHLYCSFGVMGGFMQPQGHVQVLLNMIEFGMDPQEALDAPRFSIIPPPKIVPGVEQMKGGCVKLEEGIDNKTIANLRALGHNVEEPVCGHERKVFGRGQIVSLLHPSVRCVPCEGVEQVWWAGSDGRADGLAIGY